MQLEPVENPPEGLNLKALTPKERTIKLIELEKSKQEFFITGEKTCLRLSIINELPKFREGKLMLMEKSVSGGSETFKFFPVSLNIDPSSGQSVFIEGQMHIEECHVIWRLLTVDEPEKFRKKSDADFLKIARTKDYAFSDLCVFKVVDSGTLRYDLQRHSEIVDGQRKIADRLDLLHQEILDEVNRKFNSEFIPTLRKEVEEILARESVPSGTMPDKKGEKNPLAR